jgi:hypothetical protein
MLLVHFSTTAKRTQISPQQRAQLDETNICFNKYVNLFILARNLHDRNIMVYHKISNIFLNIQMFRLWAYTMKVIPETHRVDYIRYLLFYCKANVNYLVW